MADNKQTDTTPGANEAGRDRGTRGAQPGVTQQDNARATAQEAGRAAQDAGRNTQDAMRGAAQEAGRSAQDAGRNTQDAMRAGQQDAGRAALDAGRNAQDAMRAGQQDAGRAAQDAGRNAQDAMRNGQQAAGRNMQEAARTAQDAIGGVQQDAARTFEDGARAARDMTRGARQDVAQAGASALREGADATAEATNRTGRAAARLQSEATRVGAEAFRRTGIATAEAMREATARVAREGQRGTQEIAKELEGSAGRSGEALRQMAQDLSRLMQMPRSAGGGMHEMQEAMGRLVTGMMRTNMRLTQEMFRRANPGSVMEMQGAFLRDYLHTLMDGGATVLRAARRTADDALRPLEEQLERQRQAGEGEGSRHAARVAEAMTRDVRVIGPEETVQQAAKLMAEEEAGVLPVAENGRLIGMLTERDLAVRVLAEGRDAAQTRVREAMSPGMHHVLEDAEAEAAAETMREAGQGRLPVLDRDGRVVGIVSLSDLLRTAPGEAGFAATLAGRGRQDAAAAPGH